jgi:excisionase family DNA binding protein
MTTLDQEPEYLSVAEVAMRLGVSAPTIRRKVAEGQLPAAQLGGPGSTIRVPSRAVERWLWADASEVRDAESR